MNDQLTPLRQLVDRSNRIGDDASLVVYGRQHVGQGDCR